jgi:hypothetical protein
VLIPRLCALPASLTLLAMSLTGCGGGSSKNTHPAASTPSASASATPTPVSYTAQHMKSSLLTAHDIGSGTRSTSLTIVGFNRSAVPSCADSIIKLPGRPSTAAHQYGPPDPRYTGENYAVLGAVYPDATSAASAFAGMRSKVSACPGKQHVRSKKVGANQATLPYDQTWRTTTDSTAGWTHVRSFEKRTYSPSVSVINVEYQAYDYALHGNAVIASLYWKRVKPSASGDPVAKQATALLTKQLAKFG